jgi:large subunit ribosomal protein L24
MPKFKIRKDDVVVVTSGKHKGRTGRVLQVLPTKERVLIEKVNVVRRNMKPQGGRPGGVVQKEASIHISNVALWDEASGRSRKVGWKMDDDGNKVRFDKRTGQVIA